MVLLLPWFRRHPVPPVLCCWYYCPTACFFIVFYFLSFPPVLYRLFFAFRQEPSYSSFLVVEGASGHAVTLLCSVGHVIHDFVHALCCACVCLGRVKVFSLKYIKFPYRSCRHATIHVVRPTCRRFCTTASCDVFLWQTR